MSEAELSGWPQLKVHEQTAQLRCLMTTLCDKESHSSEWVFMADRIIRIMMEFSLNFLPTEAHNVISSVDDEPYHGEKFAGRIVGVSIIRAGEAMEGALRSCCRNVRVGKILVQRNDNSSTGRRFYMAKFPSDIATRHVLLMDPMLATGGSAILAIEKLLEAGVLESNIIFINLVASPEGISNVLKRHPDILLCTAKVAEGLNSARYIRKSFGDFGDRYFGTARVN